MSRPVELTQTAVHDLDALGKSRPAIASKVLAKIQSLSDEPEDGKPLVGPLKGIWSLRVGEYRILYRFDNSNVTISTLARRSRFVA